MSVYLVRHAKAVDGNTWKAPDEIRPLAAGGHDEARGVVVNLEDLPVDRVASSPRARCLQTVAPIANARDIEVEQADALDQDADLDATIEFLRSAAGDDTVACTHGPVIDEVLEQLAEDGLEHEDDLGSATGSVWVLEADDDGFTRGRYLPSRQIEKDDGDDEARGSIRSNPQGSDAEWAGGATVGRPSSFD